MNLDPAVFPPTSGKLETLWIPKSRGTAAVFLFKKGEFKGRIWRGNTTA